ncbi:hypothetical protein ABPG75_004061 [Micractinium tetrahymenae]
MSAPVGRLSAGPGGVPAGRGGSAFSTAAGRGAGAAGSGLAAEEERHLAQLAAAAAAAEAEAARRAVAEDLGSHFVSAGQQEEGDMQSYKHRPTGSPLDAAVDPTGATAGGGGELQQELQHMAEAHAAELEAGGQTGSAGPAATAEDVAFVRGVGAQELSFASEEMDVA